MPKNVNLNREAMPRQDAKARGKNFKEVALGYNLEKATAEANRCLICNKPLCVLGCPVNVDIRGMINCVKEGNLPAAVAAMKSKNALPGICGRVCPQETQCEEKCVLAKRGAPIAVGRLERFVADWERQHAESAGATPPPPTGKRVAVVGSGPAGLTAAADLAKLGHSVTIFESLHIAGGVLMYGIPEFRLPKEIVQNEINFVASLGVKIQLDLVIGKLATVDELLNNRFDAVFLGTGAGLPMFLNIPGENLNGVYSANEFLTRVNLMKAYCFPEYDTPVKIGKTTAVIGGGNVAMDSARCALRLGAEKVYVIYRRSRTEMPARHEEIENAEEEGIEFKFLANPRRFIGNDRGALVEMECDTMELGAPDKTGRRSPIVIPGSEFKLAVDSAIVALGTTPNPMIVQTSPGLQTSPRGTVVADPATGKTGKSRVWAGGDVLTGSATVISAMGAGKRAAADIDKFLRS